MTIGLDGSRAFLFYRTGIEEYSYQVIKHLRTTLPEEATVRLYVRKKITIQNGRLVATTPVIDFSLPANWAVVGLWAPRFWTQVRLSLEMLFHPVEALFIPAHTVPVIHPKNTLVVVHGLEYEVSKPSYSAWERFYMRRSIRYSVKAAQTVIAVSHNTKTDLEQLYHVPASKIRVVSEGFEVLPKIPEQKTETILFIGRLEERKNVKRIIEAFEILKEKHHITQQLVLAGKPGFGYEGILEKLTHSKWKKDIQELGYISQPQKQALLASASYFIFPSLYEGFGLPILEAQTAGALVITSNTSSLPEVAGEGAFFVDPNDTEALANALLAAINLSETEKAEKRTLGYKNTERFSWQKCAQEITGYLVI